LSNAPVALNKGSEQAEKASVETESLLWGCPITNFKATLPFNRMKQVFAAFKKTPRGPAKMKAIIRIAVHVGWGLISPC
jgi:hypothetical protein